MIRYIVLLVFLLFLGVSQSVAQDFWQTTNGPEGGDVTSLAVNSNDHIILGSALGNVFVSTNNGSTWQRVDEGLNTANPILDIVTNANNDIFVTSIDGVFRSTNGGANWGAVNTGLGSAIARVLDLNSNDEIFLGTILGGDVSFHR